MKSKILWLSRHDPLPAQIKTLKEKLGKSVEIKKEPVIVKDADHAASIIKKSGADTIIAVLPQSVLMRIADMCAREKYTLLRADMELLHECNPVCPQFNKDEDTWVNGRHYKFRCFKHLKEIKMIEEEWR